MLPSLSRPPLEWMQSPFTPRINQPVTDQRLQNVAPTGSFELLIENARQPTRAPLARTMQLHLIEAHLYAIRSGMDSTLRCTTLPPAHRLLSTIFQ
jgi:hypothetical protein